MNLKLLLEQQKKIEASNIRIKSFEKELKKAQEVLDHPKQYSQETLEKAALASSLFRHKISLEKILSIYNVDTSTLIKKPFPVSTHSNIQVKPLLKAELKLTTKLSSNENLEFSMKWLESYIYGINYTIPSK